MDNQNQQKKANWRTQNPMVLVNRMVACHMIREIGVANIEKLETEGIDEEIAKVFLLPILDENNNAQNEIDWEAVLFKVTDLQLSRLFSHFEPKTEEAKSKLIL